MAGFSLSDSLKVRQQLTQKQQREIQALYESAAKKAKELAKEYAKSTPSGQFQAQDLKKLAKELEKEMQNIGAKLEGKIQSGMKGASEAVVKDAQKFGKSIGFNFEGAYKYVPKDIVETLISGKLYEGKWSLSSAIWSDVKKSQQDINKIIAEGLALNKGSYDIAKDLEKYVSPSAKKPWDWSKVYPGTKKQIDYSAQRLARTMTHHAYQQSVVASCKGNPYVDGILWISGHSVRTCPICADRDGQVYPPDKLPLDHPNGLCSFAPEISKDMKSIADDLADWIQGKSNPALDKWMKSMYPDVSLKETKKKVSEQPTVGSDAWIQKNLKNLQSQVSKTFGKDAWEDFKRDFQTKPQNVQEWIARWQGSLGSLINDNGQSYCNVRTISVDLLKDAKGYKGKSPYTTFYHEFGHLIDGNSWKGAPEASADKKFGKGLYECIKREYNKLKPELQDKSSLLRAELRRDDKTSGVQDIISGMSSDSIRIRWGHARDYWNRRDEEDRWMEVTSEAMAHLNSAYCQPEVKEVFTKYFPETYKYYEENFINSSNLYKKG